MKNKSKLLKLARCVRGSWSRYGYFTDLSDFEIAEYLELELANIKKSINHIELVDALFKIFQPPKK